ncbi:hypothetical protein ACS3SW_08500 [Roseobacteraceae bacterium S113]
MQNLRAEGHAPHDISRIAVDGTSGSMVLTDPDLHPVGPALMYNSKGFDAEAARIAPIAPAAHITQGTNSALARAMRLCANASRPPAHLLHQADFVAAHLMGRGGASDDNNALKTGFDPGAREWPAWMAHLIDPALLPEVFAPGAPIGPVAPAICEMFGLSFQTQVHAGTTDSIAAFLACAPLEPGVAVTSLGSTLAVKLLSPVRIDDPAIGLYAHRLGDLWLVGGASNTGGAVLKAHFTDAELADLSIGITAAPPTDLSYYPLVAPGERFPINDPHHAPVLSPAPPTTSCF